jgi:hypothetical protein
MTMSDHAWTLENLAAYIAGGLEPAERERLEGHAAECDECTSSLTDAQGADMYLMTLFADDRPGPALEDRLIRKLRKPRQTARRALSTMWVKASLAIAAVALLAVLGAGITAVIDNGGFQAFATVDEMTGAQAQTNFGVPILKQQGLTGRRVDGEVLDRSATTNYRRQNGPIETWSLGTGMMADYDATFKQQHHLGWAEKALEPQKSDTAGWDQGVLSFGLGATGREPSQSAAVPRTESPRAPPNLDPAMPGAGSPPVNRPPGADKFSPAPATPPVPHPALPETTVNGTKTEEYFLPLLQLPRTPDANDADKGKASQGGNGLSPDRRTIDGRLRTRLENGDQLPQRTNQDPGLPSGGQKSRGFRDTNSSITGTPPTAPGETKPAQPKPEAARPTPRYIIRTGDIEFEVDSFDAAAAIVRKLVSAIKGGFVATENSDRLANGKVRGAVVVRMPPESLDQFVLELRKQLGKTAELKGQKIGSQDVSKLYIDLESRLKAARTMEERLLKIIKDGKGEIKDLVAAEKELGVWNTKIEEIEGELRYYQNLVSLSTLTINLTEKEIRTAAAVRESERILAGVEVDEVEPAMREVLKEVAAAKGRVTRSEMKQYAGGQYQAQLNFDVPPDAAGPIRDRLRQLGTIARLEIDRVQNPEGGEKLPETGKLERGNTQFVLTLYNLANIQPEETIVLRVAAVDVAEAYRNVRAAVMKAKGRIAAADLNQTNALQIGANLTFAVPREGEAAIRAALEQAGDVLSRTVNRVPTPAGVTDGKDLGKVVTDKKVGYRLDLVSAATIEPREAVGLTVEVHDVEDTLDVLTTKVKELKGRVVKGPVAEHEPNGRVTASVLYEVPLAAAPALTEKLRNSGTVRMKKTVPNQQAPEGKLAVAHFLVTLTNAEVLVPQDEGIMGNVRKGLSYSLRGLSVSVSVLIVGLLFVLPWVVLIAVGWWLVRRVWGRPAVVTVAPTPPTSPPAVSA